MLVEEEMRRSIQFCRSQALWWREQIGKRTGICSELEEGLCAYALEQADLEDDRAALWERQWAPIRSHAASIWEKALGDVEIEDPGLVVPLVVDLDVEDTDEALLGIDWGGDEHLSWDD